MRGHLDVLRWARENGFPWDDNTWYLAAFGGYLALLHWVVQNGCPWREATTKSAARGGNLDVLQWARTNGCPLDEQTCFLWSCSGILTYQSGLERTAAPGITRRVAWLLEGVTSCV
ncbi:unnamed protein product, partial [Scytosiphon promiscuus]